MAKKNTSRAGKVAAPKSPSKRAPQELSDDELELVAGGDGGLTEIDSMERAVGIEGVSLDRAVGGKVALGRTVALGRAVGRVVRTY